MNVIAEFNTCRSIFPTTSKRHLKDKNIVRDKYNRIVFDYPKESKWNYTHYKIMDYFSTKLRQIYVDNSIAANGEIITDPEHPFMKNRLMLLNRPEDIEGYEGGFNNFAPSPVHEARGLTSVKNLKSFGPLKDVDTSYLRTTLLELKEFKCLGFYAVHSLNKTNKLNYTYKYHNTNRHIHYPIINIIEKPNQDKKYNIEFEVDFATPFGAVMLNNLWSGGYYIFDSSLYDLSYYAHVLYRMTFMGSKNKSLILDMETTMNRLGLYNVNKSDRRKKFKNIIEEVIDLNLMSVTHFNKNGDNPEYYVTNLLTK